MEGPAVVFSLTSGVAMTSYPILVSSPIDWREQRMLHSSAENSTVGFTCARCSGRQLEHTKGSLPRVLLASMALQTTGSAK